METPNPTEVNEETTKRRTDKSRALRLISKYRAELLVLLLAAATHVVLLFSDAVSWDGWMLINMRNGRWDQLDKWTNDSGVPLLGIYHRLVLPLTPPAVAESLATFFSAVVSAVLLCRICQRLSFTTTECVLVAWMATSFPSFQTYLQFATGSYVFFLGLFLAGVYLTLVALGDRKWLLALSGCCFFLSFTIASLLVFYFGVLVMWIPRAKGKVATWVRVASVALPAVFWVVKVKLFPLRGVYGDYNNLHMNLHKIIHGTSESVAASIPQQYSPLAPLLLLVAALFTFGFVKWTRWKPSFSSDALGILAFGVLLVVLGSVPYAMVGKSATAAGWSTRHALLMPISVSVISLGLARLLSRGLGATVGATLLVALGMFGTLSSVRVDLRYLGRWAKDLSVLQHLKASHAGNDSVYWIHDSFPLSDETQYRFYEWSNMLQSCFGGETRIGLDVRAYSQNQLSMIQKQMAKYRGYGFDDLNWQGPQCDLFIDPGPEADTDTMLGLEYCLGRVTGRSDYLGIASVRVDQIQPSDDATDNNSAHPNLPRLRFNGSKLP